MGRNEHLPPPSFLILIREEGEGQQVVSSSTPFMG